MYFNFIYVYCKIIVHVYEVFDSAKTFVKELE